jgi:hypothetical protein
VPASKGTPIIPAFEFPLVALVELVALVDPVSDGLAEATIGTISGEDVPPCMSSFKASGLCELYSVGVTGTT